MTTRGYLLIAVAALVTAAACTAPSEPPPRPPRQTPPSITTPFGAPARIPALTKGQDYRVVQELPYEVDGMTAHHYGLLDARTSYATLTPATSPASDGSSSGPSPIPSDLLVTFDLRTGDTTVLADHGTAAAPAFITDVRSNGDYLVWIETGDSTFDTLRWRLYSHELATQKTRRVASSAELGVDDPPWPSFESIRPQIVGDDIYLAAVEKFASAEPETSIYRAPLDGDGTLTKIIDDATDVYADGDDLRFKRDGRIRAWDLSASTEKDVVVPAVSDPCGEFFNDGVLVQCDDDSLIITEATGQQTTLLGLPDAPGYLNATSRWVGFSMSDRTFVYDLQTRHLRRLAGSSQFSSDRFTGNRLKYARQSFTPSDDPVPLIELLPR